MTTRPDKAPRASVLDLGETALAWLLLTPACVLLAAIVVYPIGRLVYTSFFDLTLASGGRAKFVGLENYSLVLQDPTFWQALTNTAIIVITTVPGALIAGLALALLANMPFKRRWPIRLALLVPWALPLAFVGLIFAWFFHSQYGIINDVLGRFGIAPTIWFNSAGWSMAAVCITVVWKTSSFVALILLAGLQTIPRSLYEAADVDGAGRLKQFFEITLPMLKPSLVVAMIFRTLTALQTFDIPYTMTKGGPGHATETMAMLIHKTTIDFLDLGIGSTLAVILSLISMVVAIFYQRSLKAGA